MTLNENGHVIDKRNAQGISLHAFWRWREVCV